MGLLLQMYFHYLFCTHVRKAVSLKAMINTKGKDKEWRKLERLKFSQEDHCAIRCRPSELELWLRDVRTSAGALRHGNRLQLNRGGA